MQACDGDQIDAVVGTWLYPRLDPAEQVITVDGKTLRLRHEIARGE